MMGYLGQRIVHALVTLVVAVSLVFIAVRALPRNPILARFGQHPVPAQFEIILEQQGWNEPWHRQLRQFLVNLLWHGDLGESFMRSGEDVRTELWRKVPATLELGLAAMAMALPIGVGAGVAAARWRGQWPDQLGRLVSLTGVSVPVFFLGICLIEIFPCLPTGNRLPPGFDYEPWTGCVILDALCQGNARLMATGLRHLCLPALVLSTIPLAIVARITRGSMLESLQTDYVRTAHAKGLSPSRVVWCHAFANAAVPVANMAALQLGSLLTGAVLTETVFNWPGVGRYLMEGVQNSDYAVVQGGALFVASVFVTINLWLDLLFAWLDPRLRESTPSPFER